MIFKSTGAEEKNVNPFLAGDPAAVWEEWKKNGTAISREEFKRKLMETARLQEQHGSSGFFDDSDLPVNNLSAERMQEIETLMLPRLKEAARKLRREKPHLFKSKE